MALINTYIDTGASTPTHKYDWFACIEEKKQHLPQFLSATSFPNLFLFRLRRQLFQLLNSHQLRIFGLSWNDPRLSWLIMVNQMIMIVFQSNMFESGWSLEKKVEGIIFRPWRIDRACGSRSYSSWHPGLGIRVSHHISPGEVIKIQAFYLSYHLILSHHCTWQDNW